jgi:large subunit ribosomal protein L30
MGAKNTVKIKLVRSFYGRLPSHRATITGLGLRRMHQVVEIEDTPCTRGMINKVSYMVQVVED